ncbi:hypothetical protein PN441_03500 [Spirulina major CS-329]|uniref:hypothetical protein n=1 Tax=Spirulina TaxID=1154 RepID=UPI00232CB48E|nr:MULTISPECIES: hypothetical protein [Spirulina]MDB9494700.1 hypothetical protein [Spirulina subsalsa CS-330]MDB9502123.1 hypothetical protein [Spirulina major CS-329]
MTSSVDNTSESQSWLASKNVIIAGIVWGVLSLGFFLLSVIQPEVEETLWYLWGTYIAECIPFFAGAALCYRNWQSPKIASGRNVWLGIGLGILAYFIADLIFGFWEIYWELDPEVSPADLFYMAFYICLGVGMVLAVLSKRLSLALWQWVTLTVIALAGTALAVWIAIAPAQAMDSPPPSAITAEITIDSAPTLPPETPDTDATPSHPVPIWVNTLQDSLLQFSAPINFFYIICDVALLIIAVMLLLAFWGGTFARSWQMIAAAALAKYLADMWFKYAATLPTEYASGGFLEVFFVFSGILLAIGAALEFDISSRPRKSRRRRANATTE